MQKFLNFILFFIIIFLILYLSIEKKEVNNVEEKKEKLMFKNINPKLKKLEKSNFSMSEWEYIYKLAEKKGYKIREEIDIKKDGEILEWKYVAKGLKKDFLAMKKEMKKNKLKLNLLSAFRSVERQQKIFENKLLKECKKNILKGECDKEINETLKLSSPPNYSKHHTGRVLDFSCDNDFSLNFNFRKTKCYKWLAEDNFKNAKKYNFLPSYPDDKNYQGPLPEPWEFIWKK